MNYTANNIVDYIVYYIINNTVDYLVVYIMDYTVICKIRYKLLGGLHDILYNRLYSIILQGGDIL